METKPLTFQNNPLKLYIQDIYRANRTPENKYIYELFGLTFKNIMIQGVVTSIFNSTSTATNLEISDATGTVQVYFDSKKHNCNVPKNTMNELLRNYADASRLGDDNIVIISKMIAAIASRKEKPIDFEEGSYVSVVGDIFVDDLRDTRMVSAYNISLTSVDYDIVWMEELRYLYEKFYLWHKE